MATFQSLFSLCISVGIELVSLTCLQNRAFVNRSLLDGLDNKRTLFEDLGSKERFRLQASIGN